jgi:hypothetical protein
LPVNGAARQGMWAARTDTRNSLESSFSGTLIHMARNQQLGAILLAALHWTAYSFPNPLRGLRGLVSPEVAQRRKRHRMKHLRFILQKTSVMGSSRQVNDSL